MKNRPIEEVKQIAQDMHHGLIFCDRFCNSSEEVAMVFMVLSLMDQKDIDELKKDPPGLIFEYFSKAGPRSINGMPMFVSCQMLSKEDTVVLSSIILQLEKSESEVLKSYENNP
jgi:hypothetical protein